MTRTKPMVLNHLSFPSRDVVATAAFFERQLGCTEAEYRDTFDSQKAA